MLSKLTFSLSLVLILMLAAAMVVDAQNSDVLVWADDAGAAIATTADTQLGNKGFIVVAKDEASVEAGDATDDGILAVANVVQNITLPDLAHFFNTDVDIFGGTLEVLVLDGVSGLTIPDEATTDAEKAARAQSWVGGRLNPSLYGWNSVVVSEIMWGHDRTPADPADMPALINGAANPALTSRDPANKQWIELYNNTDNAITQTAPIPQVVLRFIPDQYVVNFGYSAATAETTDTNSDNSAAVTGIGTVTLTGVPNRDNDATTDDPAIGESMTQFYRVVDRVSNIKFARWFVPGNSGNTQVDENFPTTNSIVSAYRVGPLAADRQNYRGHPFSKTTAFEAGDLSEGWSKSIRRRNIRGPYVASPGSSHVYEELAVTDTTKTVVPSDRIIINEFRNDSSDENIDWLELHNRSDAEINVNDWQISYVIGMYEQVSDDSGGRSARPNFDGREASPKGYSAYYDLPDRAIPAGGYLLIVNRQPHDTPLGATGSPLAGAGQDGKGGDGAKHQYHVDANFEFPQDSTINDDTFLIVLRSKKPDHKNGESEDAYIEDVAGRAWTQEGKVIAGFQDTPTFRYNTDIWPLKGWILPGDLELYGGLGAAKDYGTRDMAWARVDYAKAWYHKDAWEAHGEMDGIGYDQNVNLQFSPGTPGYANKTIDLNADIKAGDVTISEIMWDAGPRLDLVQWIELYNSSPSETINLDGWKLEVRNKDDDDIRISPVDAVITFKNAPQILPNRTLLIISAAGPNNIGSDNHIYNLSVENKDELRLRVRRDVLLSEAGFYLALMDKEDNVVDIAGNLSTSRKAPKVLWELPAGIESLAEPRKSIRRLYGVPDVDLGKLVWGDPGTDLASDGQGLLALERRGKGLKTVDATVDNTGHTEPGWLVSDLQGTAHYGHPNDYGNPGYRRGGPLPVSLSSFRPVRDKATGEVIIKWVTESELNNAGFNIYRRETEDGKFELVNVKGVIHGQGTTSERTVYAWTDKTAKPNVVYYYQIQDISFDGKRKTLATTHLRGNVNAAGKATTTWGDLKLTK